VDGAALPGSLLPGPRRGRHRMSPDETVKPAAALHDEDSHHWLLRSEPHSWWYDAIAWGAMPA
jgi:hypothetical protein